MAKTTTIQHPRTDMRDHAARVLAEQARQKAAGPTAANASAAPLGRKLVGNLGPGTLFPGVGKLVQRSGEPQRCGTMAGRAFDVTEAPNSRDPSRVSTRFVGEVVAVDHNGTVQRGGEWYLPPTATRGLKAQLRHGGPVLFAFEIWCCPDEDGRPASPLGYSYVTYDRAPASDNDPVLALAYAAGILERPMLTIEAEEGAEDYDPETGEVRPPTLTTAAA